MSSKRNKKQSSDKEQEYDPNDVYYEDELEEGQEEEEGEEGELIDITKLSKAQKETIERNNKKILFLKALAQNCYQDVTKLARKCGLGSKTDAEGVISVMMGTISETGKDADYPNRVLKYFNNLVPDGYPNKVVLEDWHINELTNLFAVFEEKLHNTAKIIDPDKIFGEGTVRDEQTINPPKDKKENIVMMDAAQQDNQTPNSPYQRVETGSRVPIEGYQQPQSQESQMMEQFASKYATPDIGLMEMALRRIPNPRPGSITPFVNSFVDLYNDWMQNPMKMIEQLKFFFGPTHGEHAYRLWKDYREKYRAQLGFSPIDNMDTNGYSPYNFQGGYSGNFQGGLQPIYQTQAMEEDRQFDRKIAKMMKMVELKLMTGMMENQSPTPAGMYGQNYEEVLGPDGKVIKRIFLGSNGHANGVNQQASELTMVTALTGIFKEMLSGANMEKIELMKKVNAPDALITDFTKTMMSNFVNNQNPISQIKEMMEITNMVKSQGPQENQAKSIEAIKMDIDSKIALQELDLRKMEMQHNWRMDETQAREQDSNVDKWLNVFLQMGEGIIKPVAMKFVEGLGGGNKIPNPLGGMFGNPQAQQQVNPYQQQAEAMQQQRMYQPPPQQQPPMQQQYRQEPPIQPLPPRHQINPQQQQRPMTQVSEQQVEQELATMSPEQIQEIEDKMTLDDINREKIKSAILKHKNARRVNRAPAPQISPQQQEARNVLFNPPVEQLNEEDIDLDEELDDDELSEDDFEEETSRFKPTSGQPQAQKYAEEDAPTARKPGVKQKDFREFAPETSTDITKRKKLNNQQKAMLAEGQLSPRELANAPDIDPEQEQDEDEYSFQSIPIAGSPHDETRERLIEENLKRQGIKRQGEEEPKKKKSSPKKKYEEEKAEAEKIVEQAEDILEEAELIPSDDSE